MGRWTGRDAFVPSGDGPGDSSRVGFGNTRPPEDYEAAILAPGGRGWIKGVDPEPSLPGSKAFGGLGPGTPPHHPTPRETPGHTSKLPAPHLRQTGGTRLDGDRSASSGKRRRSTPSSSSAIRRSRRGVTSPRSSASRRRPAPANGTRRSIARPRPVSSVGTRRRSSSLRVRPMRPSSSSRFIRLCIVGTETPSILARSTIVSPG